jgi:hypothetical protein
MDTLVAMRMGIAFWFSVLNTFFPKFWAVDGIVDEGGSFVDERIILRWYPSKNDAGPLKFYFDTVERRRNG